MRHARISRSECAVDMFDKDTFRLLRTNKGLCAVVGVLCAGPINSSTSFLFVRVPCALVYVEIIMQLHNAQRFAHTSLIRSRESSFSFRSKIGKRRRCSHKPFDHLNFACWLHLTRTKNYSQNYKINYKSFESLNRIVLYYNLLPWLILCPVYVEWQPSC